MSITFLEAAQTCHQCVRTIENIVSTSIEKFSKCTGRLDIFLINLILIYHQILCNTSEKSEEIYMVGFYLWSPTKNVLLQIIHQCLKNYIQFL